MNNTGTWQLIDQSLENKIPVMLLYVLESKGSSPGRQGFFMAVTGSGQMEGSIGGGIMEHKFVELARERLKAQATGHEAQETGIKKQYHDKIAAKDQSGMICSGEQTIFFYHLEEKDKPNIQTIISSLRQNKNGTLTLSPTGIAFIDIAPFQDFHFEMRSAEDWEYREKTGYKNKLFIIGGGHCALAFSRLMRSMDFFISIYDDRSELKTMMENEAAHEKHFVNDYSELAGLIEPGDNHYLVIMTMGYRTDDIALKALMEKKFRYIGVLGSRAKMQKMMDEYKTIGIPQEMLNRIHAPVGLVIKSESPEEIAVSIAAEIIKEKNKTISDLS